MLESNALSQNGYGGCCGCCGGGGGRRGGGGGGGGSDHVYDVCVSPYAPTMHAPNLGGRTPREQAPGVPATSSPP